MIKYAFCMLAGGDTTMFEGLDQINWKSIGRHVSRGGNIPQSIRNLLSSDTNVRREAREYLIGLGSFTEYVADTTPRIIPFILEVLSDPNSPDKAALLLDLSSIAEHIWNFRYLSIHKMRLYVETYDALK